MALPYCLVCHAVVMMSRYLLVTLILILYILFCYACRWRFQRRQMLVLAAHNREGKGKPWLIAFASQTGNAQAVASQTASQLQQAGLAVQFMPLNQITAAQLENCAGALLIVSTYGEGEAPDNGNRFLANMETLALPSLQYAVLALGDSSYKHFCGFGHAVHHRLHQQGATALCDLIEVDQRDASALRHWQYYLGQLSGEHNFEDWLPAEYQSWYLQSRQCLNPASPGLPAFHVQLTPATDASSWQAGDIAEVGPGNSAERLKSFYASSGLNAADTLRVNGETRSLNTLLLRKTLPQTSAAITSLTPDKLQAWIEALPDLPHREYSIASLPDEGHLDLLVRQTRDQQGELGLGSGWLTAHRQPGEDILLRIRSNPRFHPPVENVPLILIGNGTGIAGLRAHLYQRIAQQRYENWLLFGERTRAHDFFFGDDIQCWKAAGYIQRVDLAFSRETERQAHYVQELIHQQAVSIYQWVEKNAAIYVCGSLQGMAQGVNAELEIILGKDVLDNMTEQGRYCRDVY